MKRLLLVLSFGFVLLFPHEVIFANEVSDNSESKEITCHIDCKSHFETWHKEQHTLSVYFSFRRGRLGEAGRVFRSDTL